MATSPPSLSSSSSALAMVSSLLLDYIEFQLPHSDPSTCELFVSAGGSKEKIATGLWKTFLAHIPAAQEQYAAGDAPSAATIRLKGPHSSSGTSSSWFTKKTIDRFVRFVSTPNVLERVKAIEDELVQLEQVRNIQAQSFVQIEDTLVGDFSSSNADGSMISQSLQDQDNPFGNQMDSSKRHLLKAMDVRLHALQQEQNLAFSRAAKAGFEVSIVEDLMSFAKYFGADRLCAACNKFLELLKKRQYVHIKPVEGMEFEKMMITNGAPEACKGSMSPSGDLAQQSADDFMSISPRKLGNISKGLSHRTSPRRRSMSPLKKIQVGRFGNRRSGSVVVRSINYFSSNDHIINEGNNTIEFSGSDIEEHEKSYDALGPKLTTASPLPTRRLSVQAAINLFEGKHRDKSKALAKQKSVAKQSSLDNFTVNSFGGIENHDLDCTEMTNIMPNNNIKPKTDEKVLLEGESMHATRHIHIVQKSSVSVGSSENNDGITVLKNLKLMKNASRKEYLEGLTQKLVELEFGGAHKKVLTHEALDSDPPNMRSTLTTDVAGMDIMSDSESKQDNHTSVLSAMIRSNLMQSEKTPTVKGRDRSDVDSKSGSNVERESMGNSRIISSDIDMEALTIMINHPISKDELSGRQEGRFYEHYRKLRDAKMMEEQKSKRAEREAKLKLMKETLELRKAEMNARASKLSKGGKHRQDRFTKLFTLKGDVSSMEKPHPLDDAAEMQGKQCGSSIRMTDSTLENNTPSPPMTPEATRERASKPHKSEKAMTLSQKSVTKSQNSTRAPSLSPKSVRKGIGKISGYKQSVSPDFGDNPLTCSVPCFTDVRKENTKSASEKLSGLGHMRQKNGSTARGTDKLSPSESTGSKHLPKSSFNGAARKNRALQTRYSYASELKVLPSDSEDLVTSLNSQEGVDIETSLPGKIRRSAVAPIQEGKPFLRKGSGIGPGAGPGVMKSKVSSTNDVEAKVSDEDGPMTPTKDSHEGAQKDGRTTREKDEADNITNEGMSIQESVFAFSQEIGEKEMEIETDITSDAEMTHHSDDGFFSVSVNEARLADTCSTKDEELHESKKASHTISFPVDFETHEQYAASLGADCFSNAKQSCMIRNEESGCDSQREIFFKEHSRDLGKSHGEVSVHEVDESSCLSKLLNDTTTHLLQKGNSRSHSTSFDVCDERTASNQSSLMTSSPVKIMAALASDYCGPASGITMVESPDTSYASWNFSNVRFVGENQALQANNRCGISSQKPVVGGPPKEPVRGLKRLLKFALKSRATPEVILSDCLSGSTISEGDDDSEDAKTRNQSANDFLKSRMQNRRLKDVGCNVLPSDPGSYQEKGSVESLLPSSIPVPPSFKVKADHGSGNTRTKVSRSFFSLPTFRSKSNEGKSR